MWKTAEYFFANPTKTSYLMDISRVIGLAHTSVKKNLDELVKLGLITESIDKKGGRKFPIYKANRDNKNYKKNKTLFNLSSILQSGLIEFLEDKLTPKCIVIFGSYQNGEDIESSDIDLFVECPEEELDLSKFNKRLGRNIELHFNKDFNSYPNELKNNIINGITLSGFLEGYP